MVMVVLSNLRITKELPCGQHEAHFTERSINSVLMLAGYITTFSFTYNTSFPAPLWTSGFPMKQKMVELQMHTVKDTSLS